MVLGKEWDDDTKKAWTAAFKAHCKRYPNSMEAKRKSIGEQSQQLETSKNGGSWEIFGNVSANIMLQIMLSKSQYVVKGQVNTFLKSQI